MSVGKVSFFIADTR